MPDGNEVFNVSNNAYTYDEAKAVCSIYGAELATYDQIEQAYHNNGAEWCNYGWSEGQMAYFPQKTLGLNYKRILRQKITVGVLANGGFMANPNLKFGVNCFGKKPDPTDDDVKKIRVKEIPSISRPSTASKEMEAKMEKWKKNADKMLQLNSYNRNMWSGY